MIQASHFEQREDPAHAVGFQREFTRQLGSSAFTFGGPLAVLPEEDPAPALEVSGCPEGEDVCDEDAGGEYPSAAVASAVASNPEISSPKQFGAIFGPSCKK